MKDGNSTPAQPNPDPANLSHAELVSNQDATVVPVFWGQRKLAVTWVTPVYNLTYTSSSGKK